MINKIKNINPMIHCITNPISINQCANAILALGAKPIMAEHPTEVAEITKTADALLLNIGNITDVRMKSISISAETAVLNNIPFVFDAVGVSCSEMRRKFTLELMEKYSPNVLKGNYSEIRALYNSDYKSKGIDADINLTVKDISKVAVNLAKKFNITIISSGETDIVTDGEKLFYVKNGTYKLSCITGTGCMLGAICACFLSFDNKISSAVNACATLGVCGELSEIENGNGSFLAKVLDNISFITDEVLSKFIKLEEIDIDKF